MAVLLAAILGAVALILAPGALFYFDVTPKLVALLAGAAVVCLARPRAADRRFTILLVATLLAAVVSTLLSPERSLSLYGSTWRRYGLLAECAVLVVAWFVSQSTDRLTLVRGVSIASAAAAIYGIAQYFGWDPVLPAAAYHIGEGVWTIVRPPGTLGYVSYFATWLLVGGFLAISLRTRWGYAAAALCWTAMLLTGTRAAFLGLAAGLLVWLYRRGFRIPRRAAAVCLCVAAAAAAFYFSPAGANLRSRTRWFAEDRWGGARPLLWRDSFRMAVHRPAFGFGPETFTAAFPHYESRELARAYPDFAHESPHNIFLDAFVSQGVLGLFCLVAVCLLAWRASDPWLAAAAAASIVAQQFTAFTIPTALLLYATLALCVPKPAAALHVPRFALAPLAVIFVYAAVRVAAADHALAQTQHALSAGDLAAADQHYRDYRSRKLPGASADLWYSRELFAMSQRAAVPVQRLQALQMSAAIGLDATATAEDPFDAWYQLANIRAAQGDAAGVENDLRRAIAAHPNWFKPHWTLAQLLRLQGRLPEAQAEAALAVDLDGAKHPEVSR
jgi:O-antigen ligase